MTTKILIVAGEPSGDLHASNLVRDLKSLKPNIKFFGVGGTLSKKAGVEIVYDISPLALVGAVEVVKNISSVWLAYKSVMDKIDSDKPDLAILIDYPGFNLRLAKALKKRSIPVVYYISPQIWAWGIDRIKIIKRCVEKVIVLFKFEEDIYKTYNVKAEFVGHPLLDVVKKTSPKEAFLKHHGLSKDKTTIALLPGSRLLEIKLLLPIMVKAALLINKKLPGTQFMIAKHPDRPIALYREAIGNLGLNVSVVDGDTYNLIAASDFAIVASGTATLECALIGIPFVITYKASLITYILYRLVRTTKYLGLVNVIARREIVPELLQGNAKPEKIADAVTGMVESPDKMRAMREYLKGIADTLGSPGASMRAARAILPRLK